MFDKSLKILPYAETDGLNNNLKLFTELNHSFEIGDKLMIIGGFYDNTKNLSYISNFNISNPNEFNPFNNNFYTVLNVDYSNNSFVIDYTVTVLTNPYVLNTDPVGTPYDPTDNVNESYKSYSFNTIYRNVYVSRAVFTNGIFNAGIINNGIFGTDNNTVSLSTNVNNISNVPNNNVQINHIVSKNTTITKGVINSKTFNSNINTNKFKINEVNGLNLEQLSINPDNNGYGYNIFESFQTLQPTIPENILTISNTQILNGQNISLNNITFNNCKIGNHKIGYVNSLQLLNHNIFNDCEIGYINDNSATFELNNSSFNTFIELNVINVSLNTNYLELTVDYDSIAYEKLPQNGEKIYLTDIRPFTDFFEDELFEFESTITENDIPFANSQNGVIIKLIPTTKSWSNFLLNVPAGLTFDFVKLSYYHENIELIANDCTINTVIKSDQVSIENSAVNLGYYKDIQIYQTIFSPLPDDILNIYIYLNNIHQILNNNENNNDNNSSFTSVIVDNSNKLLSGNFLKCIINDTFIYQSTFILPPGFSFATVFTLVLNNIYGSTINQNCKLFYVNIENFHINVDKNITHYNYLRTTVPERIGRGINLPTPTVFNVLTDNQGMIFTTKIGELPDERLTPFRTGKLSQSLPLDSLTDYYYNHNTVTVQMADGPVIPIFNSHKKVIEDNSDYVIKYNYKFQVPSLKLDIIPNLTYTPDLSQYNVITNNIMDISTPTNRNFITNYENLLNNDLIDAIDDRTNNNFSGIIDNDLDGDPEPRIDIDDVNGVDENFVYTQEKWHYKDIDRKTINIITNLFDQDYTPEILFPDYDYTINNIGLDNIIEMALVSLSPVNPVSYTVTNNGTINLPPTAQNLFFLFRLDVNNTFKDNQGQLPALTPAPFIEIERADFLVDGQEKYYNLNHIPEYLGQSIAGLPCNGTNQYAYDNIVGYANYEKEIYLASMNGNVRLAINNYTNQFIIVKIHYWITWNYISDFNVITNTGENPFVTNGWSMGKRTKHEFNFTIQP